MATIRKKNANKMPDPQFDGVPYGNASKLVYTFETNATGVMVDGNSTDAVADGDKVVLGLIPGGTMLLGALAVISDGFTASTTADIGFEYVDGSDDSLVPQDDDYLFNDLDTAATGRTFSNQNLAPVRVAKDAYLILTVGGAAHASIGRLDIVVDGVMMGRR